MLWIIRHVYTLSVLKHCIYWDRKSDTPKLTSNSALSRLSADSFTPPDRADSCCRTCACASWRTSIFPYKNEKGNRGELKWKGLHWMSISLWYQCIMNTPHRGFHGLGSLLSVNQESPTFYAINNIQQMILTCVVGVKSNILITKNLGVNLRHGPALHVA